MARPVDLSADEQKWAQDELVGSRPQRLLHNYLVHRIEQCRTQMETATPDEVVALQVAIREARSLLGYLHSFDPESVRKTYG